MKWTLDKQLFSGLALIVFLFNLTLLNDFAWLWSGAETSIAQGILAGELAHPIVWLSAQFSAMNPFQLVSLRLPSLLAVASAFGLSIWLLHKVLGKDLVLLSFLVLAGNYCLFGLSKVASGDSFVFLFQTIGILGMIRFLKAPKITWRFICYIGIGAAIWINPISSLILFLLIPTVFYLFHKEGKHLWSLNPWSIAIIVPIILYLTNQLWWFQPSNYLGWGQSTFLTFLLLICLACLPLVGFLIAGLRSSIKNIKKKEEFSLLMLSWITIGILAQSPSIIVPISILIAKHINDYFLPNYPYKNIIRAYSTLHLILFFFLAAFIMLGGFFVFQGVGFRSGLSFSFVYWILSFLLVIGLYGNNKRLIFAGAFLIGILTTSLFSIQVFPLLEQQRIHRKVLSEMEADRAIPTTIINGFESTNEVPNLALYLQNRFPAAKITNNKEGELGARTIEIKVASKQDTSATLGWKDNIAPLYYIINK